MTPSAVAAAVLRNNGSVALQLNVMLQYVVTNPAALQLIVIFWLGGNA